VLPNPRLQRTGACGSRVEWLASASDVVRVLCGWRAGRPPLRRSSLGSTAGLGAQSMPQPFNITAKNNRTGEAETLSGEFPDDEWLRLEEFLACSFRLAACRFAHSFTQLSFGFSWKHGQPVEFTAKLPPEDDTAAFLLRMRPFVLKREPTYFPRICNVLSHRLELAPVRRLLAGLRERYDGKRIVFSITAASLSLTSPEALEKWLNAFEYHRDKEKRAELQAMFSVFPENSARALFLYSMVERAAAIGKVGAFVDGLKKRDGAARSLAS
jgi:hypothetical protein